MAAAALVMDPRNPIEQINDALRGSVMDVLKVLIPDLEPYSNEEAFNVVLNSPEMSARAFRAFREHPEAFQHLLQGPNEEPVSNDNERLSCGRTLAQVVALVVQAVAKRYFRAKLGIKSKMQPKASQEPGLVEKIVISGVAITRRIEHPQRIEQGRRQNQLALSLKNYRFRFSFCGKRGSLGESGDHHTHGALRGEIERERNARRLRRSKRDSE